MTTAASRLSDWINNAREGDQFVYWRTRDQQEWATRRSSGEKPTPSQRDYIDTLSLASEMAELGRVALFQRKIAEWQHEWIAVRLGASPAKSLLINPERAARAGVPFRRAA